MRYDRPFNKRLQDHLQDDPYEPYEGYLDSIRDIDDIIDDMEPEEDDNGSSWPLMPYELAFMMIVAFIIVFGLGGLYEQVLKRDHNHDVAHEIVCSSIEGSC